MYVDASNRFPHHNLSRSLWTIFSNNSSLNNWSCAQFTMRFQISTTGHISIRLPHLTRPSRPRQQPRIIQNRQSLILHAMKRYQTTGHIFIPLPRPIRPTLGPIYIRLACLRRPRRFRKMQDRRSPILHCMNRNRIATTGHAKNPIVPCQIRPSREWRKYVQDRRWLLHGLFPRTVTHMYDLHRYWSTLQTPLQCPHILLLIPYAAAVHLRPLQLVLNSAARLVVKIQRKWCSITLAIRDNLHWLLVRQIYWSTKCLYHLVSPYCVSMISPVSAVSTRRHLRSAGKGDLVVPRTRTAGFGPRSFSVAGPLAWNTLPPEIKTTSLTLGQFSGRLKTEMFLRSYQGRSRRSGRTTFSAVHVILTYSFILYIQK